jgi:hypothetical protein
MTTREYRVFMGLFRVTVQASCLALLTWLTIDVSAAVVDTLFGLDVASPLGFVDIAASIVVSLLYVWRRSAASRGSYTHHL